MFAERRGGGGQSEGHGFVVRGIGLLIGFQAFGLRLLGATGRARKAQIRDAKGQDNSETTHSLTYGGLTILVSDKCVCGRVTFCNQLGTAASI